MHCASLCILVVVNFLQCSHCFRAKWKITISKVHQISHVESERKTFVNSGINVGQQKTIPVAVRIFHLQEKSEHLAASLLSFLKVNWLVVGEIFVIALAKWNPMFGASGGRMKPEFFISKLGVFTIFFINGVALSIGGGSPEEMTAATKTNALIQGFNFGLMPLLVKILAPLYPDPAFRLLLYLIFILDFANLL